MNLLFSKLNTDDNVILCSAFLSKQRFIIYNPVSCNFLRSQTLCPVWSKQKSAVRLSRLSCLSGLCAEHENKRFVDWLLSPCCLGVPSRFTLFGLLWSTFTFGLYMWPLHLHLYSQHSQPPFTIRNHVILTDAFTITGDFNTALSSRCDPVKGFGSVTDQMIFTKATCQMVILFVLKYTGKSKIVFYEPFYVLYHVSEFNSYPIDVI